MNGTNVLTVLELRERTGAGMKDCQRVLLETGNNIEVASEYLRIMSQPMVRRKKANGEMVR